MMDAVAHGPQCIRISVVNHFKNGAIECFHVILGGRTLQLHVGEKLCRFERDYCGSPWLLNRRGEPLERQPGQRHPFWRPFHIWLQQGARIIEPEGLCIWDEPPPLRLRRIGSRHAILEFSRIRDEIPCPVDDEWRRVEWVE